MYSFFFAGKKSSTITESMESSKGSKIRDKGSEISTDRGKPKFYVFENRVIRLIEKKKPEKIVFVKRKPPFKCPMHNSCPTSKDEKRFCQHLSQHFASNVKRDFPFFQENGKYICPIVDCEFFGML